MFSSIQIWLRKLMHSRFIMSLVLVTLDLYTDFIERATTIRRALMRFALRVFLHCRPASQAQVIKAVVAIDGGGTVDVTHHLALWGYDEIRTVEVLVDFLLKFGIKAQKIHILYIANETVEQFSVDLESGVDMIAQRSLLFGSMDELSAKFMCKFP